MSDEHEIKSKITKMLSVCLLKSIVDDKYTRKIKREWIKAKEKFGTWVLSWPQVKLY